MVGCWITHACQFYYLCYSLSLSLCFSFSMFLSLFCYFLSCVFLNEVCFGAISYEHSLLFNLHCCLIYEKKRINTQMNTVKDETK